MSRLDRQQLAVVVPFWITDTLLFCPIEVTIKLVENSEPSVVALVFA